MGFTGEKRICRWEGGQAMPNSSNLIKLAQYYGVLVEDISRVVILTRIHTLFHY
jgi:hypothetical protein